MRELKQGTDPHTGATVQVRGETFKAECETADLWQPKWNETQTVLAAAINTPHRDKYPVPLLLRHLVLLPKGLSILLIFSENQG